MKRKRLNRDKWGFQYYPYYQMRIDHELFHGLVCLIRFTDGEKNYWETPEAGRIQVTGKGMTWLEMIPDGARRVITAMYFPDGTHDPERKHYPAAADERYRPSVWYIDIIERTEYDEDGVAVFIDKYLDVILTPEGDVKVDDRRKNGLRQGNQSPCAGKSGNGERHRDSNSHIKDYFRPFRRETDRCREIRASDRFIIKTGTAIKVIPVLTF